MIKKIKNFAVIFFCFSACVWLCTIFDSVSAATTSALKLCVKAIIPSLFPFFIIADILMTNIKFSENGITAKILQKVFNLPPCAITAFAIGMISGYPVGASAVMKLYKENIISKNDAEQLICLTNNSGPLFLICSVGCGMFGSLDIGIMLYAVHVFTALCTAAIAGKFYTVREKLMYSTAHSRFNIAKSVEKAFMQCVKITGFVVFFAIINEAILRIAYNLPFINTSPLAQACLLALFEMTNSISRSCEILSVGEAMCVASFAAAWSGLSVLFQVKSVTENMLSTKKYLKYKFFSGLAAAAITSSLLKIGKNEFAPNVPGYAYVVIMAMPAMCLLIIGALYTKKRCRRNDISNKLI